MHLYKSLALPVFDYCEKIYDNCTAFQRNFLERVHLAGARVCRGALKSKNINVLLQDELGFENWEQEDCAIKCFAFTKLQMVGISIFNKAFAHEKH